MGATISMQCNPQHPRDGSACFAGDFSSAYLSTTTISLFPVLEFVRRWRLYRCMSGSDLEKSAPYFLRWARKGSSWVGEVRGRRAIRLNDIAMWGGCDGMRRWALG